jgi:uncharacterized integral membrane protein
MKPKIIAVIAAGVLLLILVVQNLQQVTTHILFLDLPMPVAVLIFVVAIIAYGAGVITDGKLFRRPKGPPHADVDDKKKG